MNKKTLLLGIILAVFSFPSYASAGWTDTTTEIESKRTISFAGSGAFIGGLGGITCAETTGSATLEPGTTGSAVFTVDNPTTKCSASGGLAACTVQTVTPTYTHHPSTHPLIPTIQTTEMVIHVVLPNFDIKVTHQSVHLTMSGAFCPYHEIRITGDPFLTPDNRHAAQQATLSGTVELFNQTTGAFIQNMNVSGTLNITPSGTYGTT